SQPSKAEIHSAIEYVSSRVSDRSTTDWSSRLLQAVTAVQSHPVYHRWAVQDQMVRASRRSSRQSTPKIDFPCDLQRSTEPPTSVHRLRPADIDVVAAMGDSLTAGSGARATGIVGLLIEYRGYAWSDMPKQAESLVRKLKSDSNVDFNNDWKLITLFVGGNDICDYCKDKEMFSPENYIRHIRNALDYLHDNVPRAFVNVVEVLDVTLVKELKDGSPTCSVLLGSMLCKCPAFPESEEQEQEIANLQKDYQRLLNELIDSGRYDTRDDFTVVNQPFLRDSQPPRINGEIDFDFFAPDCFHFGVRGHSAAGKGLWNNMLEPVGQKTTNWDPAGSFSCPTQKL
uniref:Phospholipase B1, membrane-associated n=1 Tax=Macrostomum lignano TaxID=282301 RepID=A0A1I8ITW1_9PLAT